MGDGSLKNVLNSKLISRYRIHISGNYVFKMWLISRSQVGRMLSLNVHRFCSDFRKKKTLLFSLIFVLVVGFFYS